MARSRHAPAQRRQPQRPEGRPGQVTGARLAQLKASADASSATRRMAALGKSAMQRMTVKNGVLKSSFGDNKIINSTQAVITASSADSFTGGHARMFMEFVDGSGLGKTMLVHLVTPGDGRIVIDIKPLQAETPGANPRALSGREVTAQGKYQAYAVSYENVQKAIDKVNEIKAKADAGTLKYQLTANFLSGTMNCADFVAQVMQAAGQPVSAGVMSMPSSVSTADKRSNDQIYEDAK